MAPRMACLMSNGKKQCAGPEPGRASRLAGGKNPGRTLRLALDFELLSWAARDDSTAEPASVSVDAVVRLDLPFV